MEGPEIPRWVNWAPAGVLSAAYFKDQTDPVWKDDAGYKEWAAFLDRYYPDADRTNSSVVSGFLYAQAMVRVLEQCGDDARAPSHRACACCANGRRA